MNKHMTTENRPGPGELVVGEFGNERGIANGKHERNLGNRADRPVV